MVPLVILVALIAIVVSVYGDDSLSGASQVALIFASAICVGVGMITKQVTFDEFEHAVTEKITSVSSAIILLLLIGAISGMWMVSGIVPTMIYYGLQIIHPTWFLVTACIICALVSLMTGSSWTTIATIGVALMGIGHALGFGDGWVAGAIISGAYFGDKMSPLSDTTVMASSTVGTPVFTHIHYMLFTTVPTITITLIIFMVAGLLHHGTSSQNMNAICHSLSNTFVITPWLFIVPILTGIMIARKLPSMLILFLAIIMAAIAAMIAQPHLLTEIGGQEDLEGAFRGVMQSVYGTTSIDTGDESLNDLVSTKGMAGMMGTIWLIICAMVFGGAMTATRMLESLMQALKRLARNRGTMVGSTALTGILLNVMTSDQYLSIILTASMYKDLYQKNGYEPRLLSRTCEDSATVVSVLIPWNSCGMTQSSVLGVSTLVYMPYCFFNLLSPIVTIIVACIGWKITRVCKS